MITPNHHFSSKRNEGEFRQSIEAAWTELAASKGAEPRRRYEAVRTACHASLFAHFLDLHGERSPDAFLAACRESVHDQHEPWGAGEPLKDRAEASLLIAEHKLLRNLGDDLRIFGDAEGDRVGVRVKLAHLFGTGSDATGPAPVLDEWTPEWREWRLECAHRARYRGIDAWAYRVYAELRGLSAERWEAAEPYGHTVIDHYIASLRCGRLGLLVPTCEFDERGKELAARLAWATVELLADDSESLSASPALPTYAASHSKHLAFAARVIATAENNGDLADLGAAHLKRARQLSAALGLRKSELLFQEFEGLYALAGEDYEGAMRIFKKIIEGPGPDSRWTLAGGSPNRQYAPRIVFESLVFARKIALLDPSLAVDVDLTQAEFSTNRLADRRYVNLLAHLNTGGVA